MRERAHPPLPRWPTARRPLGRRLLLALPAALVSWLASALPAHADFKICNRMSYVVEAAIGIDDRGATATRGWFRLNPAQCQVVGQGAFSVDRILLHARVLPLYGAAPAPQNDTDRLCVADGNFVIAAARDCRGGQRLAVFTEVKPGTDEEGNSVAYLAEGSEYDDEQARLAGIQRLLAIGGYDIAPIDGVDGPKTQGALGAFLKARGLPPDAVKDDSFFATLTDAVQAPSPTGLTWCNDTPYKVLAAIAIDDGKAVTTRGWYGVAAGKCLHPDLTGQPKQVFSFAEAVNADGRPVKIRDKPLNWGGPRLLCTRDTPFEIAEQGDCSARGLSSTGFAAVDMSSGGQTLRLSVP